jgi:hypothetical protein
MSNPIYDNHHLTQNNTSYELATDFDAPVLPLKDIQVEHITNIAHSGVISNKNYNIDSNGDIYTNTKQAKEALSERAGYLLTGKDCDKE